MQFPGFLHNLNEWLFQHAEGVKNGTADAAKVEASPIVQFALQAAENAAQTALINAVAPKLGVDPTPAGITGVVTGLIDGSASVPTEAKEPLKLLLGGLLTGTNFLSAPAEKAVVSAPSPENDPAADPTAGQEGLNQ